MLDGRRVLTLLYEHKSTSTRLCLTSKKVRILTPELLQGVTECTFVESSVTTAKFFASPVTLGKDGVETIHGYGKVTAYEQKLIDTMLPDLIDQAEKGFVWAKANQA